MLETDETKENEKIQRKIQKRGGGACAVHTKKNLSFSLQLLRQKKKKKKLPSLLLCLPIPAALAPE